jgi:hypothetical protein
LLKKYKMSYLRLIRDSFLTKIENMKSVVLPIDRWGGAA